MQAEFKSQTPADVQSLSVAADAMAVVNTSSLSLVNPDEDNYIKHAKDTYWPTIAVGLTELETYRATPKVHAKETRYTNGLGATWQYWYNDKGKLFQEPNTKENTAQLSADENYEQAKRHLIYETMPLLRQVTKGKKNIDAQQAIALVWAGYQRPNDMADIADAISNAKDVQQIADAFSHYDGHKLWREGTLKRRWWCAAYAVGAISIEDFLALPRDAFANINLANVYRDGHFLVGPETVKYALARAGETRSSSVAKFLNTFETGRKLVKAAEKYSEPIQHNVSDQKINSAQEQSMALLNQADMEVGLQNFDKAIDLYKRALSVDVDNMEAYSSLALAYKKMGDKNKSVRYYELCAQTVVTANARMNAHKGKLLDRAIKAASYFNAGLAREEIAKLYLAQGKASVALENYKKAQQCFHTALSNADMVGLDGAKKQLYQQALDRGKVHVKKMQNAKTKQLAYRDGINKMGKNKSKGDVLIYGKERDLA